MQTQALPLLRVEYSTIGRLGMELSRAYRTMVLGLILVIGMAGRSFGKHVKPGREFAQLNRSSFPNGFLFGAAASAYQYEGAWNQGGRGASIWDNFTHKYPGKIADGNNGDVAIDSYHRYKEDIGIMKDMGLDAYRFSISWSRILPKGNLAGGINEEGVRYYNNLINELIEKGIQPFVTLFHWDLPQALQDEYQGFLSPKVVDDFRDYVDVCFKEFGDRVKHWGTLNEPYTYAVHGYAQGVKAPGRCSAWQHLGCIGGDSGTEPYLVAHYQLLAHAAAVKLYKDKYQASQKGMIGLTLVSHWFIPYNNATHNRNAALRSLDFMLGWFLDPVTYGDYPRSMRALVGNRLPKFTKEQSQLLRGSMDYLGLNYFTANYAHYARPPHKSHPSYLTDSWANLKTERNGMPIGLPTGSDWLYVCPIGIYDLLQYVKDKYNDPLVYVTGNGVAESNNSTFPLEQQLADPIRIDYYHYHLLHLRKAIDENKTKVKGYFVWSLFDNFEWNSGYSERFGINYVDYENGLKRLPKHSAAWFKNFLKK